MVFLRIPLCNRFRNSYLFMREVLPTDYRTFCHAFEFLTAYIRHTFSPILCPCFHFFYTILQHLMKNTHYVEYARIWVFSNLCIPVSGQNQRILWVKENRYSDIFYANFYVDLLNLHEGCRITKFLRLR